jgi:hypothetical protein
MSDTRRSCSTNDHIVSRHDFEADNHTAALELARQYLNGHDVEFWHSTYFLGRLKAVAADRIRAGGF